MGGGARTLVKQPKTAVFLRKSPKPGGSQSVNINNHTISPEDKLKYLGYAMTMSQAGNLMYKR